MLNDANTCEYFKLGMQECSKLKTSQCYYTTSMHGKHFLTMWPQNRAEAAQIMNKISLEQGQNVLEWRAKTTCNVS